MFKNIDWAKVAEAFIRFVLPIILGGIGGLTGGGAVYMAIGQ